MSSLTLLGTGTCEIRPDRMATSALINYKGTNIVFDLGRGVTQRISELNIRNNEINHIVISHFHPDHFSDIIPLLQCSSWSREDPRTSDLNFYGPKGLKKLIYDLIEVVGKTNLLNSKFKLNIFELSEGKHSINEFNFNYVSLPDSGNHGISFKLDDKLYGLTGDATKIKPLIDFSKNLDLVVIDSGHLSDFEIIELIKNAPNTEIICSHVYREIDLNKFSKYTNSKISVGEDLQKIL